MKPKRFTFILLPFLLIPACAPTVEQLERTRSANHTAAVANFNRTMTALAPTATPTLTSTPAPTVTPTPSITPSPTPALPWMGSLYFDEDHNGERDPEEKALAGFKVCVSGDCAITDEAGRFEIPNTSGKAEAGIAYNDPNAGTPDEMRLFVKVLEETVIPEYNQNGVFIPEQVLKDISYTQTWILTSGQVKEIGMVRYEPLNTCPVDMSKGYIYQKYSNQHQALDIGAAYGTHLFAPSKCQILRLLISSTTGGHALHMRCNNLPGVINLGHVDLSFNEYDTLSWYGIPKKTFFNEDGSVNKGVSVVPLINSTVYSGQDLHLYLACTGRCSRPHVHISFDIGNTDPDPLEYLDCTKK